MLQTTILLTILAILPHDDFRLPAADPRYHPFDVSLEKFWFRRTCYTDGPLPSTHRVTLYRHEYFKPGPVFNVQHILIHNPSQFYWYPDHPYDTCRIWVQKNHGRYEIIRIETYNGKPIKPHSLRLQEPDDDEADEDG